MSEARYRSLLLENLREERTRLHGELKASGKLNGFLRKTAREARELRMRLTLEMAKRDPPPKDFMKRVGHLASHQRAAEEIVLNDLILVPQGPPDSEIPDELPEEGIPGTDPSLD